MSDDAKVPGESNTTFRYPLGIWFSLAANALGVGAGAVFLLAERGARFRGMEPEAGACMGFGLMAGAFGLFVGLPVSMIDFFWRRFWICGLIGMILSLTPLITSKLVADVIAELRDLDFDN